MAAKKKSKSALLLIILLVLGIGVIGFNLARDTTWMQKVPVLKNLAAKKTSVKGATGLEKLQQENDKLKKDLAQKNQELQTAQKDMTGLRQQSSADDSAELKKQIASLNKELLDAKSQNDGDNTAYQNLAQCYTEMKSKDAADILSRLNDEDVIGILGQMNAETAAGILQNMDHDRAATISRKMLITAPKGE